MDADDLQVEVYYEFKERDERFEDLQRTVWELQKENQTQAKCIEVLTEHLDGLCKARDEVKEYMKTNNEDFASLQSGLMYLLRKDSQEAADDYFKRATRQE